jgi:hexosaminidase
MDPTQDRTYAFLNAFIAEMSGLFPDEYFHIGGDEVNGKQWNANSRIRAFKQKHDLKDNRALQAYFNRRLQQILAKHGKKMIGWHEILHPDLPKSVLVQLWQRQPGIADITRRGYAGILSYAYLDHAARVLPLKWILWYDTDSPSPGRRNGFGRRGLHVAEFVNPTISNRASGLGAAIAGGYGQSRADGRQGRIDDSSA